MSKVIIPFTHGVEEIELVAIVDILRRANVDVTIASLDGKIVTGRSGITIQPDTVLKDTLKVDWDMLILPGGLANVQLLQENSVVKNISTTLSKSNKYVAAICAAPAALAHFGLLENKCVTSHPSVQEDIEQSSNATYLQENIVEDGLIITSRGAGTAIEFALHLAKRLTSKETADHIKSAIIA